MKRGILWLSGAGLAGLGALAALVWLLNARGDWDAGSAAAPAPAASASEQVARGSYLARAGNCMGCHSTAGGPPWAGGLGLATPFGTVFSSNLTPDPATGIGRWTADDFWRALHNGRAPDGRLLYPAFPYTSYTQVSRDDADALFAYLRSLPPASQPNRPHELRWPYNTQLALAVWRALSFTPGTYTPDAAKSAEWNRGAYLVRGLGHCSACHAPRNALGATDGDLDLAGGLIPVQNWYAPSLALDREAGVAGWDRRHVVELLKTGVTEQGSVSGPMAEVVARSTQYLSDADLQAMATYLQDLPDRAEAPLAAPAAVAAVAAQPGARASHGAKLYEQHCAQCHGDAGQGAPRAYPPLAGNRAVTLDSPANLVQMVLNGGFAPATAGNPRPFGMPPYALVLSERDVADVLTYIRGAWGNRAPGVSEFDVSRYRGGK
jgi:mono/diheme cytochrome c family protein